MACVWDAAEHLEWRAEQEALWRLSTYAQHLDRALEWWEIDAMLAVDASRDLPE